MGLTGYCREAEVVAMGMGAVVGEGEGGAYLCQVREDEVARRWVIYRHKGAGVGAFARWPGGQAGDQVNDRSVT